VKQFNFPNFVGRLGLTNSSELILGWLTGATQTTSVNDGTADQKKTGVGDMLIGL